MAIENIISSISEKSLQESVHQENRRNVDGQASPDFSKPGQEEQIEGKPAKIAGSSENLNKDSESSIPSISVNFFINQSFIKEGMFLPENTLYLSGILYTDSSGKVSLIFLSNSFMIHS